MTGNLLEVTLEPKFPTRRWAFACHVEPVPNQIIYDVEFKVLHKGEVVNNKILNARKVYNGTFINKAMDR